MNTNPAASITKAASQQTYYTIRFLVDRERVDDAYRAYAYFRWVDDTLDAEAATPSERRAFIERQKSLLQRCYRGDLAPDATLRGNMLVELVRRDREKNSGLQSYLRYMMQVMDFDAVRRGRLVSQLELNEYTRWLSTAVMECIHHFIGHDDHSPHDEGRYLAVAGAHITHMLRDTFDDMRVGYYNIAREVLEQNHIGPLEVHSVAYRSWVESRVQLARNYFSAGKEYFTGVQNWRCRLACYAYIARFEWLLDVIEREHYILRPQYDERKSFAAGLLIATRTLMSALAGRGTKRPRSTAVPHPLGKL